MIENLIKLQSLFVPYEIAVAVKERGFNEPCLTYWFTPSNWAGTSNIALLRTKDISFDGYINQKDSNTTAPIYQQVFEWLESKNIYADKGTMLSAIKLLKKL